MKLFKMCNYICINNYVYLYYLSIELLFERIVFNKNERKSNKF